MLWTNTKRVIKAGFINFWRNGFVSLSSVFVMTVTLFVLGSIIFTSAVLNSSLQQIQDKVDINVYFLTTAPESDVLAMKQSLEALPQVAKVTYMSRDDVLNAFKDRHQNEQSTLDALNEIQDNPFGSMINIKAKDPSYYGGITSFVESKSVSPSNGLPIIYKVNYHDRKASIDELNKLIIIGHKIGFFVTLTLILISILITFNTIRLAIFISRDEISVMRLVGASNKFVRGPFIIVGIMYAFVSTLITLILLYPITYWLGHVTESFGTGINLYQYYLHNFGQIFLILLASGIFIGAVSSYMAVRKYLDV